MLTPAASTTSRQQLVARPRTDVKAGRLRRGNESGCVPVFGRQPDHVLTEVNMELRLTHADARWWVRVIENPAPLATDDIGRVHA